MPSFYSSLLEVVGDPKLLFAAFAIVTALLGACIAYYRRLYLLTREEHLNSREVKAFTAPPPTASSCVRTRRW